MRLERYADHVVLALAFSASDLALDEEVVPIAAGVGSACGRNARLTCGVSGGFGSNRSCVLTAVCTPAGMEEKDCCTGRWEYMLPFVTVFQMEFRSARLVSFEKGPGNR